MLRFLTSYHHHHRHYCHHVCRRRRRSDVRALARSRSVSFAGGSCSPVCCDSDRDSHSVKPPSPSSSGAKLNKQSCQLTQDKVRLRRASFAVAGSMTSRLTKKFVSEARRRSGDVCVAFLSFRLSGIGSRSGETVHAVGVTVEDLDKPQVRNFTFVQTPICAGPTLIRMFPLGATLDRYFSGLVGR